MDYNPQNNGANTQPIENNSAQPIGQTASQNNNTFSSQGAPMGTCPPGASQYNEQYGQFRQTPSPMSIYNNTPQNNAPQYHYGMPHNFMDNKYLEEQRQKVLERRNHEKKIKGLGANTGITLLILLAVSFFLSYVLIIPTFYSLYNSSLTFSAAFGIIYSVLSVGGAFLIGSKLFKKTNSLGNIPYNPPKDKTKSLLLILIGFGGCLASNYLTAILRTMGEAIGIYSNYTALDDPSSTPDVIMIFIGSAIIPPLVEEFALRGVLLQSLKKYGNVFAIVSSAFVFGVFHGNAVQMPFAFLCGLFLGYAVIASESLWTGVIIHALMNAMSCVSSALTYYLDEYASNTFFYVGSVLGIVLGILALVIYISRYKDDGVLKNQGIASDISVKDKFGKFISSPIMIVAIIIFVIQAISQLSLTPVTY